MYFLQTTQFVSDFWRTKCPNSALKSEGKQSPANNRGKMVSLGNTSTTSITRIAEGIEHLIATSSAVRSAYALSMPQYYAVPNQNTQVVSLLTRLGFVSTSEWRGWSRQVDQYSLLHDSHDRMDQTPNLIRSRNNAVLTNYRLFPTSQEDGHLLGLILEPFSEFGLQEYPELDLQLTPGSPYPILRVD